MAQIKKNFFYSSLLTTANYLFPLLTFPYVSRVLGVTNIGIVNFVDSIINYFMLFSMMGMNIVGIREIANDKNDQEKLNRTFSSLFLLNTITTTIVLIALFLATVSIPQLKSHAEMMAIGALKLLFNYMLIEWLYKGLEDFKFITVRSLLVKVIYVVFVFVFIKNQTDYIIYYFLIAMTFVLNALVNMIYSRHFVKLRVFNVNVFMYLKSFLILGVYYLLTSMYTTFNVAYLGFVSGETEVGYYTTATKLYTIFIALFTAFTGVVMPRMSSLIAEGKTNEFRMMLSRSYKILFAFTIPLICFTVVYAPLIVRLVSGSGYEGAITPMRIMMPLMLIIGYEQIIIVQGLMPMKKDKAVLINSFAGCITGVLLNILLVSSLKSIGSSIVWFCSELIVLGSGQYYINKYIKATFPWKFLVQNLMSNVPLFLAIVLLYLYIDNMLLSLLISLCVLVFYFSLNNLFILKNEEVYAVMQEFMQRVISTNKKLH